jgi:hypothetical protein
VEILYNCLYRRDILMMKGTPKARGDTYFSQIIRKVKSLYRFRQTFAAHIKEYYT